MPSNFCLEPQALDLNPKPKPRNLTSKNRKVSLAYFERVAVSADAESLVAGTLQLRGAWKLFRFFGDNNPQQQLKLFLMFGCYH